MILIVNSDDMCVGIYSSHSARVAAALRAARHEAECNFIGEAASPLLKRQFMSHSGLDRFLMPDTTPIAANSVTIDEPP